MAHISLPKVYPINASISFFLVSLRVTATTALVKARRPTGGVGTATQILGWPPPSQLLSSCSSTTISSYFLCYLLSCYFPLLCPLPSYLLSNRWYASVSSFDGMLLDAAMCCTESWLLHGVKQMIGLMETTMSEVVSGRVPSGLDGSNSVDSQIDGNIKRLVLVAQLGTNLAH